MVDRIPAEVFPPGEYIKDELETRGWSEADLAEMLACPPSDVAAILNGSRELTQDFAQRLAEIFGTSAEVWSSTEARFRRSVAALSLSS